MSFTDFYIDILCLCVSGMEMGQWVMGHGSNGSPFVDGSHGSWGHWLTHDDEITAQYSLQYFVLS